ncbi:RsmE family RNA methyltransferase [Treponema sp.]|uniref:RsmE family RNA methyltransferase n=1 Tax=Treponema sp. TaxID=166 RepID=UPI001B1A7640|nr:RsmE family RNA methyltransferase [Treponema sp.]MBE6353161.1 RNA methyltransferase [Treponema sp.]MBO6176766.1 16S rRNA (uracil(1498)-N(3))-methyltransferase [Treponema sp.]
MRQFIAETELDSKGCLYVTGKKFRYLSSVLRCRGGDMIDVRLPDGSLQPMTVAFINTDEKKITLQVAGTNVTSKNDFHAKAESCLTSKTEFWLFMFAAKPPKMELIIRQAVECGVAAIVPVEGEFCQKSCIESAIKKSSPSDDRWQRIITEARQQSGSPVETKIYPCMKLQKALELWQTHVKEKCPSEKNSLAIVLYEQTAGTKTLHECAATAENITAACVVSGAEGGITPDEIALMQDSGFIPVHCRTNILRCETAALYGTAALQTVLLEKELWQSKE